MWKIWSFEHNAWWKASWGGYTKDENEAGLYGFDEAVKICKEANAHGSINEAMVPVGISKEDENI